MSRVGKKPIDIPSGVQVAVQDSLVKVSGPKGELTLLLPTIIQADAGDGQVTVTRSDDTRGSRSFHGLYRSLIANMVEGVEKAFTKNLVIEGVGFKAEVRGSVLVVTVGFSSPVEYAIPEGVDIAVDGGTRIKITSIDKQKVGQAAARIRGFSPAEPYKGKGIRYADERIRRKEGKTVA
jgi:large subunit ribosomal protein L6